MDDQVYRIKEYPNKEKGFFFDEEKFAKFSYDLFKVPYFAILCAIYLNILYILSWMQKISLLSIFVKIFIHYIIIEIILINVFKINEIK